ncbi:MAG: hypothetical protein EB059_08825 [Alphaproteobacteria bacterium]|nr:hypothetical protein [Alphaproteobacteria bacterium]
MKELNLKSLLTQKWLEKNASDKSHVRGIRIFEDDWAVRIFESIPARLRAEVMGMRFYVVTFQIKRGKLEAVCTCPAFRDFDGLCKHIVGAGLHAIEVEFKKEPRTIAGAIQKHVAGLKEAELRELAFHALLNDEDFRNEFSDDDGELLAEEDRRQRWKE